MGTGDLHDRGKPAAHELWPVTEHLLGTIPGARSFLPMSMKIFRLEPVADPGDPNWDRANDLGPVIVRAKSPAHARLTAGEAEASLLGASEGTKPAARNPFSSAFCDERLYRVVEDKSQRFSAEGESAVLAGLGEIHTKPE